MSNSIVPTVVIPVIVVSCVLLWSWTPVIVVIVPPLTIVTAASPSTPSPPTTQHGWGHRHPVRNKHSSRYKIACNNKEYQRMKKLGIIELAKSKFIKSIT